MEEDFCRMEDYSIEFLNRACSVDVYNAENSVYQKGYVVGAKAAGLLLDFLCVDAPPELIPFERLSFYRSPFSGPDYPLTLEERVQILVRESRKHRLTWRTGKLITVAKKWMYVGVESDGGERQIQLMHPAHEGFLRKLSSDTVTPVTKDTFKPFEILIPRNLRKMTSKEVLRFSRKLSIGIITEVSEGVIRGLLPWTETDTAKVAVRFRQAASRHCAPNTRPREPQPEEFGPLYYKFQPGIGPSDIVKLRTVRFFPPIPFLFNPVTPPNIPGLRGIEKSFPADELPLELLAKIFRRCDFVFQRLLSRVSHKWQSILRDSAVTSRLTIEVDADRKTNFFNPIFHVHHCLAYGLTSYTRTLILINVLRHETGARSHSGETENLQGFGLIDFLKASNAPLRHLVLVGGQAHAEPLGKCLLQLFSRCRGATACHENLTVRLKNVELSEKPYCTEAEISYASIHMNDVPETEKAAVLATRLLTLMEQHGFSDRKAGKDGILQRVQQSLASVPCKTQPSEKTSQPTTRKRTHED